MARLSARFCRVPALCNRHGRRGTGARLGGVYLAQNKDLPEEYRRQLTAFVYEPGWTEGQMSAALLYNERDMAKAVIAQNTESPAEGWRSLYNDFTAARDEILQPAIDALSKGMKQGVDILPLGEDGRGIRVSNNAPWYQEYYKEHGKAPNQAQLRDLAYLLTVGDASAPQVEGWIPTTREAAEAMDAARGELDELNGHIKTLENIKERMMKVDSFEVKGSAGLSPEGYKLYRQIIEMLEKIGGEQKEDKQTKVARMNAMLFAHHADIFAAAMRTQEGKEKYTALDYFRDRFALRYGGTDMREGADVLHQAAMKKSGTTSLFEFSRQMRKPESGSGSRRKVFLRITAPSGAFVDVAQDDMIHMHNHHPDITDGDFAVIQENMENFLRVHQDKTGKGDYGGETVLCKIKTPRGVAGVSYELLSTGRIFLKTAFFDNEKGIDSWITKSGTSKDLMNLETEKRGNAASMLTGHPSRTTDVADSLTPSVVRPLSLPIIQERIGIVNQKERFEQSAWHGSPHDFVEFLLSAIGTGEGAQAHGWGLYLAEKREAASGYGGKLYHVEIPDNDVLIDEQKTYDAQPAKVRKNLEKLVHGLTLEQLENWNDVRRLGKAKVIAEIMDTLSESDGMNIYGTISDLVDGQQEASELLNQYGIKGITYHDEQSGRGFVVFDDKAISIIEKFNQMLRQEVRGEISKEDGKRIITLFESADESTFMHEMGHMFLMDLDELAKMDEASAKELETVNAWAEWHDGAAEEYKDTDFADEFRDHENAILAAKKSGDAVAEKAALERWRQERFARGFEMYLSEGKAPSAAMRSVFRRFKAFLCKIYNLAKNAGAMPSVEVQAVMARMIATENEITEAKLDERFRPIEKFLGKESVESLLGETEAELYKRWTQEAQEEAEDILRKRVMNDLKKEAREEFNEKVEAERERKRAELENDPVYLAEYAMRQGGSTDVVMNWFPSYAAYKKARGKRKTLENELKDYMTEYARKLDEHIMQEHLSDENVARAMQTPKAYHRRLAIESAALRRKERLMRVLGGNAPEEVKKKAVAEAKKAESPTRRGTKQEVRKDIRRLHQIHGYP